jgi:hypothetical protein
MVLQDGDWIHVRCFRIEASAQHVRESRRLTRQAREQIEESKERVLRSQQAFEKPAGVPCAVCRSPVKPPDLGVAKQGLVHRRCLPPQSD